MEGALSPIQRLRYFAPFSGSYCQFSAVLHSFTFQCFTLYSDSHFAVIHTLQCCTLYSDSHFYSGSLLVVIHSLQMSTLDSIKILQEFSLCLEWFTFQWFCDTRTHIFSLIHNSVIHNLQWFTPYGVHTLQRFTITAIHNLYWFTPSLILTVSAASLFGITHTFGNSHSSFLSLAVSPVFSDSHVNDSHFSVIHYYNVSQFQWFTLPMILIVSDDFFRVMHSLSCFTPYGNSLLLGSRTLLQYSTLTLSRALHQFAPVNDSLFRVVQILQGFTPFSNSPFT